MSTAAPCPDPTCPERDIAPNHVHVITDEIKRQRIERVLNAYNNDLSRLAEQVPVLDRFLRDAWQALRDHDPEVKP